MQRGRTIDSSLRSHRGGTPWEIRTGTCYKSPLFPFMKACMIRVPIDPPALRRKLDVQWMKWIWVQARRERWSCGAHSTWNRHWTISAKTGWKPPSSARSVGTDQKSCSRSSFVSGRTSQGVTCFFPSDWQVKPILVDWPKNKTELHRKEGIVADRRDDEAIPIG